jgi:hypothetical protein
MQKDFNTLIYSLKTNEYDEDFANDIISLAEMSEEFKIDVLNFCLENDIKPLTKYDEQKGVEVFHLLFDFCCERSVFYGLAEKGEDEIYTY